HQSGDDPLVYRDLWRDRLYRRGGDDGPRGDPRRRGVVRGVSVVDRADRRGRAVANVVSAPASGMDQPRLGRGACRRRGAALVQPRRRALGITMVYLPPHFTETREDVLLGHVERYDFALLVTQGSGLIASQVPFLI